LTNKFSEEPFFAPMVENFQPFCLFFCFLVEMTLKRIEVLQIKNRCKGVDTKQRFF